MADQSDELSAKRFKMGEVGKISNGLCIAIDRVGVINKTDAEVKGGTGNKKVESGADIKAITKMFADLGCTVKNIKDKDATKKKMQRKADVIKQMKEFAEDCKSKKKTFDYVVIFIAEKRDRIIKDAIRKVNNQFTAELEKVENFQGVQRIVINHVWVTLKVNEKEHIATNTCPNDTCVKPNEIHIISKIEGEEGRHSKINSSFVKVFCNIFSKYVNRLSIIKLVTKILRERELGDFFGVNKNGNHRETRTDPIVGSPGSRSHSEEEAKKDPYYNIFEEVSFVTGIQDTEAPLITGIECDSPNGHSPASSTSEPPLIRLEDRPVSKIEMEKLLSMKIESKEQKIPKYKVQRYAMNRKNRGFCVIINQSNDRAGAFVDEQRVHKLFKDELFFEVKVFHNKKHNEIEEGMKEVANATRDVHQCIFVFLMAHGDQHKEKGHLFFDVIGEPKCSDYIFSTFTECETLKHKPKIFIIQTCFGDKAMGSASEEETGGGAATGPNQHEGRSSVPYVPIARHTAMDNEGPNTTSQNDIVPSTESPLKMDPAHKTSDTLWIHSTLSGFRSYRHMVHGSHLIQHIDRVFRESAARNDINKLMTDVNGLVSKEVFNKTERQQPIAKDNTLNANLYLNPGYIETSDARLPEQPTCDPLNGSVLWSAKTDDDRLLMVAAENNKGLFDFNILNLDAKAPALEKIEKNDDSNDLRLVSSGVMISQNKHLVVADKDVAGKDDNNRKVVFLSVCEDNTWSLKDELDIEQPIALCAINSDGFGILSEKTQKKKNKALFEAYHRKHYDIDFGGESSQDTIQAEVTLRLNYGNMSSRDQVVYNRTKILILCVNDCTVSRFDMSGIKEFTVGNPAGFREIPSSNTKGKFLNPCSVFWSSVPDDNNCTQLVVACCNAIHTADVKPVGNGKWDVTFNDPKTVDKIDRLWYDDKDLLYLTDDFIDYTTVEKNSNAFDTIQTDPTKKINDGWLRQTIWKTHDEKLVIGGAQATDISVIDRHSLEVLFTINPMTHGTHGRITSGFCSAPNTHVIISGEDPDELDKKKNDQKDGPTNGNGTGTNGNGRKYPTQWVVELDDNNNIKVIKRANHTKNGRYPVVMFPVDSKKYGVICKETGVTDYAIIELRDKQEHKLKRTLKVQHKDVHINDHACVDEMGNIYMSSFKYGVVNKFDRLGKKLAALDKIKLEDATPDTEVYTRLVQPYTLFLASDGSLVVQCCNAMYKYDKSIEKWVHITGFVGPAWDMCCVGRKMYTIYKEEFIPWEIDAGSVM